MYNGGAYLEVLEGLLKGEVQRWCSPCGPWAPPGEWCTMRVHTLRSLRASWRVMYKGGAYLEVLEGLLKGEVQRGCSPCDP